MNIILDIPAKLKSQSLPPGMNAKMIEKHSTTSSSTTKTASTKTSCLTSSTTTVYVNKHLSKSHDFEAHESSSANSTLERKDEDSFFKRLLNRSTKKKKGVDERDDNTAFIDSEIKRIDSKGGYTHKGPEMPVIDLTATNKTSFKADIKENLTKREETILQTKLIVETKPFESASTTTTNSILNTYVSNEAPEKPIKPIVKSDKPRSGPASRQRVLPQEISVSPTLPIIKVEAKIEEPAVEKLPPKSPKKSPSTDDPKSFRYSPKSAHRVPSSGTANETHNDDEPTIIVRESKFIKLSQQRSEDNSIQATTRFKKFSSEDMSSSPPKSVWPEELKVRSSRVSGILSKIDAKCDPQSPKRKAVEKSKSFRMYKEDSIDNLQNSMPSLPDLTVARQFEKPKFLGVKPTFISTSRELPKKSQEFSSSNTSLKFEINDNNLIRPKDEVNPGMFKKNIILTTKSPTTISTVGNQNITQIEDNIDKIMKSSFVTVLKKSSTNDLFEIKNKNNVSVTSITTSPTHDVVKNSMAESWLDRDTSSSTSSPSTPSSPSTKVKLSPDTCDVGKVPEFMKIQLNRIDAVRPKSSHVVLSKNAKETDTVETKERRFSNESVEIAETKTVTSPVSTQHHQFPKQSSLTKSTESVSSNFAPISPIKRTFERTTSSSSMTDVIRNGKTAVNENVVIERRKSVSDEKLKFEKKIEELKAERKRSISEEGKSEPKSMDDESVVVLRKKSLSQSNNNKEDTPELMKVFARRSLKVKDDDFQVFDEVEKVEKVVSKLQSSSIDKCGSNVDSDKENQSSSEEKLDKLPKAEIAIQGKPEEKSKKDIVITGADGRKSNIITPKPFMMPSRFGNVNNYRNTSAFTDVRKAAVPSTLPPSPPPVNTPSIEQNNNENGGSVNNNRHTIGIVGEKINAENSEKGEFKGILQRRAEWEKRAQAFK